MSDYICYVITILYRCPTLGDRLVRCALKVKKDVLNGDADEYPCVPENKKQFFNLLPPHVRELGTIVDIEEIFEVQVIDS